MCEHFTKYILPITNLNWHEENIRVNLCIKFEEDINMKEYWKSIIGDVGIHDDNLNHVHWDRIRLRIQPSSDDFDDISNALHSTGRFSSSLPIHRDTWAGNIMQQLNWWTPLLPITENKTLAIYPSFFDKHVPNSSGFWSVDELRRKRQCGETYPQLPILLEDSLTLEETKLLDLDRQCIVISPGDVLVFSGAHLHGSVLKKSPADIPDTPRFSSEVRTIDMQDVAANIGAPNVDGSRTSAQHMEWFRPLHS